MKNVCYFDSTFLPLVHDPIALPFFGWRYYSHDIFFLAEILELIPEQIQIDFLIIGIFVLLYLSFPLNWYFQRREGGKILQTVLDFKVLNWLVIVVYFGVGFFHYLHPELFRLLAMSENVIIYTERNPIIHHHILPSVVLINPNHVKSKFIRKLEHWRKHTFVTSISLLNLNKLTVYC